MGEIHPVNTIRGSSTIDFQQCHANFKFFLCSFVQNTQVIQEEEKKTVKVEREK